MERANTLQQWRLSLSLSLSKRVFMIKTRCVTFIHFNVPTLPCSCTQFTVLQVLRFCLLGQCKTCSVMNCVCVRLIKANTKLRSLWLIVTNKPSSPLVSPAKGSKQSGYFHPVPIDSDRALRFCYQIWNKIGHGTRSSRQNSQIYFHIANGHPNFKLWVVVITL